MYLPMGRGGGAGPTGVGGVVAGPELVYDWAEGVAGWDGMDGVVGCRL
jgi:hypothetical protein